jgi:hypothetical protein
MTSLRHLRSSTANKRPDPTAMVDGQLAMNYDIASPGLFFKDDNGTLIKVGPVHVGTTAPNVSPAAGGTAGNSIGEQWLDTTSGVYVLKVWDGSAWRSESGTFVDVSGDTMTGALTMANQQAVRFSETTANGSNYIALQADAALASNKTITLPDTTGTVVTTGDTGTVTSTMIANGTILNADVNASAAIAGTKVSPDFGSQTIVTTGIFSSAAGTAAAPSIAFTGDTNTGLWSPAADTIAASTGGSERLRIDSSGRLLVGTSTSTDYYGATAKSYITDQGGTYLSLALETFRDDSAGAYLVLGHSRSGTAGNYTILQPDDGLGLISFNGSDGTDLVSVGATIKAEVDGTPGADDMPGRLVFSVTADGASSPTEAMRIRATGNIEMGKADSTEKLAVLTAGQNNAVFSAFATNASYASSGMYINVNRAANNAYSFYQGYSGDFADLEFRLRGDGNGTCDGAWTGGGADYAEYFEWSDSNLDEEDRRGISVVLDGDKIREAVAGEDPIGVISGNPSVVGDAAWNKWTGKYLRDEFGTYIQEDYEVEDEDGNTVVQQRRKLNPAYDPDAEYIPREQRPEWDCVGLMGKLRIRKGQVTGSRWIKMRDISDSVEEWLVR